MNSLSTDSLSWARRERDRHRALIGGAVLVSALIASAAHNERRMFTVSEWPLAFAAIPEPEPTSLRSAIMGYLNDGCAPVLSNATGEFTQLLNRDDCGPARERGNRKGRSPIVQTPAPLVAPAAYFASPEDVAYGPDGGPLFVEQLPLVPGQLAFTPPVPGAGGGGLFPGFPIPLPGFTPPTFGAIPEPSTWALMISGFGLAGMALRRRPVQVKASIS